MATQGTITAHGLEGVIGYHFLDPLVLQEAVEAAGVLAFYAGGRSGADGNKRLALIGDAILRVALVEHGYDQRYPKGENKIWPLRESSLTQVTRHDSDSNLVDCVQF